MVVSPFTCWFSIPGEVSTMAHSRYDLQAEGLKKVIRIKKMGKSERSIVISVIFAPKKSKN